MTIPDVRGLLAVPIVGPSGGALGVIQLSDKYAGEFTEDDEAILVQFAQMAAVAIENTADCLGFDANPCVRRLRCLQDGEILLPPGPA